MQAPLRSLDQRMDALRRANEIRVRRAQLKKDLKAGTVKIEDVLSRPPQYVETAKVIDILMAVPKFGRVKAAARGARRPPPPLGRFTWSADGSSSSPGRRARARAR